MDAEGRATQDAKAENNAGAIIEEPFEGDVIIKDIMQVKF